MARLFGTDGVRGIANEKLNIELAMRLGSAAAAVISGNSRRRPVFVIGMDSRMSSDMLALACAAGDGVLYLVGIPYMYLIFNGYLGRGMSLSAVLWAGMLVYLPGDAVKIAAAALLAKPLLRALPRQQA